jgi:hypothetical protein
MQGSQESDMLSDEGRKPGVIELEVVEPYVDPDSAVDQIVAQAENLPDLKACFGQGFSIWRTPGTGMSAVGVVDATVVQMR